MTTVHERLETSTQTAAKLEKRAKVIYSRLAKGVTPTPSDIIVLGKYEEARAKMRHLVVKVWLGKKLQPIFNESLKSMGYDGTFAQWLKSEENKSETGTLSTEVVNEKHGIFPVTVKPKNGKM